MGYIMMIRTRLNYALIAVVLTIATAATAQPNLAVNTITWDMIGLDATDALLGPAAYQVGVRVVNTGVSPANNVQATFVWDGPNAFIDLTGSPVLLEPSLAPGAKRDFYFPVQISRSEAARLTGRAYHVEIDADGLATRSTPVPRQLLVVDLAATPNMQVTRLFGPNTMRVGEVAQFAMEAAVTSPLSQFVGEQVFPTAQFDVLDVETFYMPPGAYGSSPYADACGWDDNPLSPTYRSCVGPPQVPGGLIAGTVITTTTVFARANGAATIGSLLYGYSGGLYQYGAENADPLTVHLTDVSVPRDSCYTIADTQDQLVGITPNNVPFTIGATVGATNIEAMALSPGGETLYAADARQLGTLDRATGVFTPSPFPFGFARGALGTLPIFDVDGLGFDARSGIFYGINRREATADEPDFLFQIDPATGLAVLNGFGLGVDYVVIDPPDDGDGPLTDVDDIAIDPVDGTMYAVANRLYTNDRLITINKFTGATSVIAPIPPDMEGLTFANDGTLRATSGLDGAPANSYFILEKTTGLTSHVLTFPNYSDYEAISCLSAPANIIAGSAFRDVNYDSFYNLTSEVGQSGIIVRLHHDVNGSGIPDIGDVLIQTAVTDLQGEYTFSLASSGQYVVSIDTASLPPSSELTRPNALVIGFDGFGLTSSRNDFGFNIRRHDLAVTKHDFGVSAAPGSVVVYFITYENKGNTFATGVQLQETVPANTTFLAASSSPGWLCADPSEGNPCMYTIGGLAPATSGSLLFAVRVNPTISAGADELYNVVTIDDDGSNGPDIDPSNNTDDEPTPLITSPDLRIVKTDSIPGVLPGGVIVYTLAYENKGPQGATGVVIRESVPAHTTFRPDLSSAGWSWTPPGAAGSACAYPVGSLNALQTGQVTFAVQVNGGIPGNISQIYNQTMIEDDGANGPDPTPGDNTDDETTPIDQAPDLRIVKTDDGITVRPTHTIIYRLAYSNVGTATAIDVHLFETVPADTTFNAGASTPGWGLGDGAPAGTPGNLAVGDLAPGASGEAIFTVDVNAVVAPTVKEIFNLVVIAAVNDPRPDPTPEDNISTETTPILTPPDLLIVKSHYQETACPGEPILFNLLYYNQGESAALNAVIEETVPAYTTFSPALSSPGWLYPHGVTSGSVLTYPLGTLQPGQLGQIGFALTLDEGITPDVTLITNVATIDDDDPEPDPTPENNVTTDTVPIGAYHFSTSIAYEDLKDEYPGFNDFDYNDVLVNADVSEFYNANSQLTSLSLRFELNARGAAYDQSTRIDLGIHGPAQIEICRYDETGMLYATESYNTAGAPIRGIIVFPSDMIALLPWGLGLHPFSANTEFAQPGAARIASHMTVVSVLVGDPTLNPLVPDNPNTTVFDEHQRALYGHNIYVINTGQNIYAPWDYDTGTQDIVDPSEHPASPLLGFPVDQALQGESNWKHSIEKANIWNSHSDFVGFIQSGGLTKRDWRHTNTDPMQTWPLPPTPIATQDIGAQPQGLYDAVKAASPISATPLFADLEGDGAQEIIYGRFLNLIEIADADGVIQLRIDPFPEIIADSQSSPALADLDDDGDLEIIRCYDNGTVVAYHHDGVEYLPASGTRLTLQGTIKSTPAVIDLNADGAEEIVVQTGDNLIYVLDSSLGLWTDFPVDLGGSIDVGGHYFFTPSPAVADITGNGLLDIVAVNIDGDVHVLDTQGASTTGWPVSLGIKVMGSPAVGDIDNDGSLDIVVATSEKAVTALSSTGATKTGWPVERGAGGSSSPSLEDTNGNGLLEVFVGSFDGQIYGYDCLGQTLTGFPSVTQSLIHASPFFIDIDGDGAQETLCGSDDGGLHLTPGPTEGETCVLAQAASLIVTAGAVGDVDNDGLLEIAFGSHDGLMRVIQTDAPAPGPGVTVWNGFRGSTVNAGTGQIVKPNRPAGGVASGVVNR